MKILLDQNMTPLLCRLLEKHTVEHVKDLGWNAYSDSLLLHRAEQGCYDLLITADKNMVHQQNHRQRRIALPVLSTNRRDAVRSAHPTIVAVVQGMGPGDYRYLELQHTENLS